MLEELARNDAVRTVAFLALGLYFSIALARGLQAYLSFRRLQPTALLTWRTPRPQNFSLLLALGVLATIVTLVNGLMQRPFWHIFGQATMALYFLLIVPLLARIHVGFYEDGVWAETGFVPYGQIRLLMFRESPELVLILLPRGGPAAAFRLGIPKGEYAAVRKLLEEKRREHLLAPDQGLLGLT